MKNQTLKYDNPSGTSPSRIQLYPWQEDCLAAWRGNHFHGIVNVVTGAGKTVLALAASARLAAYLSRLPEPQKLRVKIVVPSVPLASQWAREVQKMLPALGLPDSSCGVYHGSQKGNPEQAYMVYVLNSARYTVARHILADMEQGYHVLLIADECHRCASPENRRIFDFLKQERGSALPLYHSLGLSATIRQEDYETVLKPALGQEIYRYRFADALRDGHISDFSIYHVGLSFSAEELEEYAGLSDLMSSAFRQLSSQYPSLKRLSPARLFAVLRKMAQEEGEDSLAAFYLNLSYRRKGVSCMASARSLCCVSLIGRLEPSAKILIFGERIEQAQAVYQALSILYPGRVGRYHSQMTPQAKKNTLAAYRDGIYRILVSCKGLDEGIDVPEASVGIVLSGSSVSRQRIQRLGRILRRKEGKSACLYYFYVRESSEDGVYLANPDGRLTVCDLSYSALEDDFFHPAYEKLAAGLLRTCSVSLSAERLAELRTCLLMGLVRPDWLEAPKVLAARVKSAKKQREKNYWIAMKKLAELRQRNL